MLFQKVFKRALLLRNLKRDIKQGLPLVFVERV